MSDAVRDRVQSSLGNAYTLERELGGGGMSRVFVARDEALGRDVVVKVLAPELAEGLSAERFTREIRLAAGLQEPHIVPVHAAGVTADGLPWYTMPYVEGESLRARLARGPLPLADARKILDDVARALAYAHAHGIVHRDIKPENVLLSSGTAVVTDFGIAKALQLSKTRATDEGLTRIGTSLGTPAYMAPEQAAADPATDHRADLYAWGVMAYELLAGRHPFADRVTPQALMAAHMSEVPTSLGRVARAVPRPIAALVARCLAKDPSRRPASAAELLATLESAGARTSPVTTRRTLITAVAAILLLAAGAAWRARRAPVGGESGPTMLAVLPFEHQGPADQAVFADGLTDAVTAKLGALPGLAVIDRRSAAQYRGTTKPAKQIGTELGVQYLLEGIVRWAKDASGAWRAQVTPTLVDARTGMTRWTGEPSVVTPIDPFTAQGTIATDVARTLEIALRPVDQARLARHMTDDARAFAAYQRGIALLDGLMRGGMSAEEPRRAAEELEHALMLDSSFADAWGALAEAQYFLAIMSPGDRAADSRLRETIARGLARAPDQPTLLMTLAALRSYVDRDTAGVDSLIGRIIAGAPSNAGLLAGASQLLAYRGRYDSSYALGRRAARLDPRSAPTLLMVGSTAMDMRRWDAAVHDADALIALDSADQRGWMVRAMIERYRGDTLSLRRVLDRALARLPHPTNQIMNMMPYAGAAYGTRYLALSARDLGVTTLFDSVMYYDAKADVFLLRGDLAGARARHDSLRTVLAGRKLGGGTEYLLSRRAFAEAASGADVDARRTLAGITEAARPGTADMSRVDGVAVAAAYARLGDSSTAMRWLAATLSNPMGSYTARAFTIDPKLLPIRGTPLFERFLREHPE
ncbi:MAG: protein kinase [Gemmatimonadetes bacterium]|nr:protein kinase [Gemmatimonadota bacterium]